MSGLTISDAELEARWIASRPAQARLEEVTTELVAECRDLTRLRAYDEGVLIEGIAVVPGDNVGERRVRMTAPAKRPRMLPVWIHKGTGVYGDRGVPIRPKKEGGFLVFKVKGQERPVFARSVRGRPATPVMRDAGVAIAARLRLRWVPSKH